MRLVAPAPPVELIPPTPQTLWGRPAVANFALGGLGAGLYMAAAFTARFEAAPALTLAAWLGPVLVLAGFAVVATEAGRPLRGPRVLARVWTSWMSRELWLGGAFAGLAAAELVTPAPALRVLAWGAALALALAQGFIVRCARGVAAWDAPIMPLVFLASSLASGTGLLLVVEALSGRIAGGELLWVTRVLLAAALVVWMAYIAAPRDQVFVRATRRLRRGPAAMAVIVGGYVLPFLVAALGTLVPAAASGAALVAGALMIAGQVQAKWLVILRAGELRPITLAGLSLRRAGDGERP
jgi:formate-dependent nitrite reductase membrane component NrfD